MSAVRNWRIPSVAGVCIAIACFWGACRSPVSDTPIVQHYRAAGCIPFSADPKVSPHTRGWDTALTLKDGSRVIVTGAQMPGGRINISYLTSGRKLVAADAGDYVYPSDVRLNAENDILYVKASGLAAGLWQETWLFEYDLHNQKLIQRSKIASDVLPVECPEPSRIK